MKTINGEEIIFKTNEEELYLIINNVRVPFEIKSQADFTKALNENSKGISNKEYELLLSQALELKPGLPKGSSKTKEEQDREEKINSTTEQILNSHEFKTIYGVKSETIFYYDNGIWRKGGREIIESEAEAILDNKATISLIKEVVEKIKRLTIISFEEFNKLPEGVVCLLNGLLDLKTGEFRPHSSDYYFKSYIPIKYNPEANCPECLKFFNLVIDEEDLAWIQEWFGFNLYNNYFLKKGVICFGEPDTGKTVFLNLLSAFIGVLNISGIPLQDITRANKFQLAALHNKYANVFDDLSSYDLGNTGGFKMATGGGRITGEYKFGDTFSFQTFAKHTFACNVIPSSSKDSGDMAYYLRWLPLGFYNIIPKEEQDPFLIEKLTNEQELSGLLNWSLEGIKRLLKNKCFSFNKTVEEVKDLMDKHTDSLSAFAIDALEEKQGYRINKEDLFEIYSAYCHAKKINRLSLAQVSRRLPKIIGYCQAKHDTKKYWEGINLKPFKELDTLDAFFITIYDEFKTKINNYNVNYLYMFSEKASKTSEQEASDFTKKGV